MPKQVWLLIIGMLVNVVGSSFLWPLNTIYMNEYLGQSLSMAGFVLMLNAGAGVIGNLVGGVLFDKVGGYWSIFIGSILSLISLVGLVFWHGWPTYVWFLILLGFLIKPINNLLHLLSFLITLTFLLSLFIN